MVDNKVTTSTSSDAGKNLVNLLEKNLFDQGLKGNVIIGVPEFGTFFFLQSADTAARASKYFDRMFFTIDGEGDNAGDVISKLISLPSARLAYGTGVSICSPLSYRQAILIGAANKGAGVISLDYIWTIDSENSMKEYIRSGAQGIITNYPSRLVNLLGRQQIPLASPGTIMPASTSFAVITQSPICSCKPVTPGGAGCVLSVAAPAGLACMCDNYMYNYSCLGAVVACKDPNSPFCTTPGTARENCLQGGGNCAGYPEPVTACSINAGPIWNQTHANQVCPGVCGNVGWWTGQWTTTVPGSMSVCQCRSVPRNVEAGPIWDQQDANKKCPNVCRTAHGSWTGQWTTTVPGSMSVFGCDGCIP